MAVENPEVVAAETPPATDAVATETSATTPKPAATPQDDAADAAATGGAKDETDAALATRLDAADEALIASLDPAKYDLDAVRAKLRALRDEDPAKPAARRRRRGGMSSAKMTNLMMVGAMCVVALSMLLAGPEGLAKPEVATLEQTLFKTVISPQPGFNLGGRNGPAVDWVVFFYKPYCGACRRVRPFFHALGTTTNHTDVLRFGEIDCVRHRALCRHAGAKAQPMIKIYSATRDGYKDTTPSFDAEQKKSFLRRPVATWQGVLIAYEVLGWFQDAQRSGFIRPEVTWAPEENITAAMQAWKRSGDAQTEAAATKRSDDPKAYLVAVDLAVRMGFHDALFMRDDALEGDRLGALVEWLDALGFALPRKDWRTRADELRAVVAAKPRWKREALTKQLVKHGFAEPSERDWAACGACAPRGPEAAGTGGYACSLWLLFHALLANCDRRAAPHVLDAIRAFVVNFFGCADCAAHFGAMWDELDGAAASNQIDANVWLWRAHNAVSLRLKDEDPDAAPYKAAWPDAAQCASCFDEAGAYDEDYVFQFLMETFCFDSDTFVCAAFDDPSVSAEHRGG